MRYHEQRAADFSGGSRAWCLPGDVADGFDRLPAERRRDADESLRGENHRAKSCCAVPSFSATRSTLQKRSRPMMPNIIEVSDQVIRQQIWAMGSPNSMRARSSRNDVRFCDGCVQGLLRRRPSVGNRKD